MTRTERERELIRASYMTKTPLKGFADYFGKDSVDELTELELEEILRMTKLWEKGHKK